MDLPTPASRRQAAKYLLGGLAWVCLVFVVVFRKEDPGLLTELALMSRGLTVTGQVVSAEEYQDDVADDGRPMWEWCATYRYTIPEGLTFSHEMTQSGRLPLCLSDAGEVRVSYLPEAPHVSGIAALLPRTLWAWARQAFLWLLVAALFSSLGLPYIRAGGRTLLLTRAKGG